MVEFDEFYNQYRPNENILTLQQLLKLKSGLAVAPLEFDVRLS